MHNKIIFLSTLLSLYGAFSNAEMQFPLQRQSAIPKEPIQLLPAGTTRKFADEWSMPRVIPADVPDKSVHTVWLRMFPLINNPLGDPFPQTQDVNNVDLQNAGGLNVFTLDTGKMLGSAKSLHLDFTKTSFMLGTASIPLVPLWIVPIGTATTELDWDKASKTSPVGIRVHGGFAVEKTLYTSDSNDNPIPNPVPQWSLLNVLEVETYLLAVVPSEVLPSWEPAMLQAQAIAARTYTLFQMAIARATQRNWDLDPTTWYQSYRGVQFLVKGKWETVEDTATSKATTDTTSQVITYNGEVIDAYFSGNSGGITCTAGECFAQPDVPYLKQINDAPGVQSSSGGTWGTKATITPASITTVLTALGIKPPSPVVKLQAYQKGPSGRTWQLSVILEKGIIDLDSAQTRKVMHIFGTVRSFLYTLGNVTGGTQSIVGHGYGHGVGLSQEGGELFAKKGWSAEKILLYFYAGTQIQKL